MAWGLARISSKELTEWIAFYGLEPFGDIRADYRSAVISATVANVHRDPRKRPEPWAASDFMPQFEAAAAEAEAGPGRAGRPTWQQLLTRVVEINRRLGGRDLRENR